VEIQTLGVAKRGGGGGEEGKQLCRRGIKCKTKTSSKNLQLFVDLRQPRRVSGPKTVTEKMEKNTANGEYNDEVHRPRRSLLHKYRISR